MFLIFFFDVSLFKLGLGLRLFSFCDGYRYGWCRRCCLGLSRSSDDPLLAALYSCSNYFRFRFCLNFLFVYLHAFSSANTCFICLLSAIYKFKFGVYVLSNLKPRIERSPLPSPPATFPAVLPTRPQSFSTLLHHKRPATAFANSETKPSATTATETGPTTNHSGIWTKATSRGTKPRRRRRRRRRRYREISRPPKRKLGFSRKLRPALAFRPRPAAAQPRLTHLSLLRPAIETRPNDKGNPLRRNRLRWGPHLRGLRRRRLGRGFLPPDGITAAAP